MEKALCLGDLPGVLTEFLAEGKGVCLFPVAPQGAGKTTVGRYLRAVLGERLLLLSADGIRMELFLRAFPGAERDYGRVWAFCRSREGRVARILRERLESAGEPFVYLDRMNLTPPSRKPFLSSSRVNVALVLDLSLREALERNRGRAEDKLIPDGVVASMFASRVLPLPGEFEHVLTLDLSRPLTDRERAFVASVPLP